MGNKKKEIDKIIDASSERKILKIQKKIISIINTQKKSKIINE